MFSLNTKSRTGRKYKIPFWARDYDLSESNSTKEDDGKKPEKDLVQRVKKEEGMEQVIKSQEDDFENKLETDVEQKIIEKNGKSKIETDERSDIETNEQKESGIKTDKHSGKENDEQSGEESDKQSEIEWDEHSDGKIEDNKHSKIGRDKHREIKSLVIYESDIETDIELNSEEDDYNYEGDIETDIEQIFIRREQYLEYKIETNVKEMKPEQQLKCDIDTDVDEMKQEQQLEYEIETDVDEMKPEQQLEYEIETDVDEMKQEQQLEYEIETDVEEMKAEQQLEYEIETDVDEMKPEQQLEYEIETDVDEMRPEQQLEYEIETDVDEMKPEQPLEYEIDTSTEQIILEKDEHRDIKREQSIRKEDEHSDIEIENEEQSISEKDELSDIDIENEEQSISDKDEQSDIEIENEEQSMSEKDEQSDIEIENEEQSLSEKDELSDLDIANDEQSISDKDEQSDIEIENEEQSISEKDELSDIDRENEEQSISDEDEQSDIEIENEEQSISENDEQSDIEIENEEQSMSEKDELSDIDIENEEQSISEKDEQSLSDKDEQSDIEIENEEQSMSEKGELSDIDIENEEQSISDKDEQSDIEIENEEQSLSEKDELSDIDRENEEQSISEKDEQSLSEKDEHSNIEKENEEQSMNEEDELSGIDIENDEQSISGKDEQSDIEIENEEQSIIGKDERSDIEMEYDEQGENQMEKDEIEIKSENNENYESEQGADIKQNVFEKDVHFKTENISEQDKTLTDSWPEFFDEEESDSYLRLMEFDIELSKGNWKTIKPSKDEKHKKIRKLKIGWTDMMYSEFTKVVPGCVLSFKYHNVQRKSKNPKKGNYFVAKAFCKHKDCGEFKFSMKEKPPKGYKKVRIRVNVTKKMKKHKKEDIRKRQLQGKKRKIAQEKLQFSKASTLYYESLGNMSKTEIAQGNFTKCQSKNILRKAKSEWNVHDNLHQDPFTELTLVKEILEEEERDVQGDIRGYIQEISYYPLMVVLYKRQSFLVAKETIKSGDGVFYFDATGSLVNKFRQKQILYYAMVVKGNRTGSSPVPVLEFLSERQGTYYIMRPLITFFGHLSSLSVYCRPKRIEIDFSWAILHSILLAVNQCTINEYLVLTYKKCHGETVKTHTAIHICAAHMLKALRMQIKEKLKDADLRHLALRVFALFQTSNKLETCLKLWNTVCLVFGKEYMTEDVKEAITLLKKSVMNVCLEDLDHVEDVQVENVSDLHTDKGIRKTSPFYSLFRKVRNSCLTSIESETDEPNLFFCEDMLDLLGEQYLPLLPLWGGLVFADKHSPECRDTNACVENWFKIIKHDTMIGKKRERIGKFISTVHMSLKGRLAEYYKELDIKRNELVNAKRDKEKAEIAQETWRRKAETTPRKSVIFTPPKKFPTPKMKGEKFTSVRKKDPSLKRKVKGTVPLQGKYTAKEMTATEDEKVEPSNTIPESPRVAGIPNRNNICWLISSVQALAAMNKFTLGGTDDLNVNLEAVLAKARKSDSQLFKIDKLTNAIGKNMKELVIGEQHDCGAFLTNILSTSAEMQKVKFQVELNSILHCTVCRQNSSNTEMTNILVCEIPSAQPHISVETVIKEFTKEEVLMNENSVYCHNCSLKTTRTKHIEIKLDSNEFLIIQLKRYNMLKSGIRKMDASIHIDRLISFKTDSNNFYLLAAVQCHLGRSVKGGHYITFRIDDDCSVWRCDDSKVKKCTLQILNSKEVQENCYFIYYCRIKIYNCYIGETAEVDSKAEKYHRSLMLLPDEAIVAKHGAISLTSQDIQSLNGKNWLNDQVVNMYFKVIQASCPWVAVVDSFFMYAVRDKRQPEKYLRLDMFQQDKILIPVLNQNHWSLLVLEGKKMSITLLDSGLAANNTSTILRNFLHESENYSHGWTLHVNKNVTKQTNFSDCGVFMCQNAVNEALHTNVLVNEVNVNGIRKTMAFELLTGVLFCREK